MSGYWYHPDTGQHTVLFYPYIFSWKWQQNLVCTITRLLHRKADKLFPTYSSAVDLANKCVHFFEEKIVNIRSNLGTPVIPDFFRTLDTSSLTCQLVNFAPTSNTELSNIANNIVMKSWSRSLTNRRFHFRSWKGRNHAFLRQFSGFYFCLSIFLSFSRNNSANTIFWSKVAFRYRVSL